MTRNERLDKLINLLEKHNDLLKEAMQILAEPDEVDYAGEWITTNEAAEIYQVSPQTIRSWIHSGQIKGKQVSERKYLVHKPSLANKGVNT